MCNCPTNVEKTRTGKKQDLFPPQRALLGAGYPGVSENWVICSPTGSGKTLMAEWAIEDALRQGASAIYVAPLRAIVEERLEDWSVRKPEWNIGLFTGETTRNPRQARPKDEGVLLMTPEKLSNYLLAWKNHLNWISRIGVLIIDEFHLVGDPHRGATLENMIGRLQRTNPLVRIAGFSGTLSNYGELARWLKARTFVSQWRPVPVEKRVARFKNLKHKAELLRSEVEACREAGGKTLVFVNSRKRCEALAKELQAAGLRAEFHHAGLPRDERESSQKRMRAGEIEVLLSTSALEMGVNFPARKVVIYDAYCFDGDTFAPMSAQRFQQCAGRAGRAGYDTQGEVSLFLPVWDGGRIDYLTAEPEPVRSGMFGSDCLLREVLGEVAGRLSITAEHLEVNLAARTLWRQQGGAKELSKTLQTLREGGLMREVQKEGRTYLNETALGRVATQMAVSPNTITNWGALHRAWDWWQEFDVLLAVCLAREATPVLGFNFEEIDQMTDLVLQIPSASLDLDPARLAHAAPGISIKRWLAAVKAAVLLTQHTRGRTLEELARDYDCYPTDLQTLKQNCAWVLAAAQRVFQILSRQRAEAELEEGAETQEHVKSRAGELCRRLALMIEYGVPAESVGLVQVPGIGSKRVRMLIEQGVTTLAALVRMRPAALGKVLRMKTETAEKLLKQAKQAWAEEQAEDPFALSDSSAPHSSPLPSAEMENAWKWPSNIDPYRLCRALELEVTHSSEERIHVRGGTEPHQVSITTDTLRQHSYACDCADFSKGTKMCKHVIRARLELHDDREIVAALRWLQETKDRPLRYSLGELWMKTGGLFDRFNGREVDYAGTRFLRRAQEQKR
jgi:helicase